jgi:hypothetical protein
VLLVFFFFFFPIKDTLFMVSVGERAISFVETPQKEKADTQVKEYREDEMVQELCLHIPEEK